MKRLTLAILLAGCSTPAPAPSVPSWGDPVGGLAVMLTVDQVTTPRGELIEAKITIRNVGEAAVPLRRTRHVGRTLPAMSVSGGLSPFHLSVGPIKDSGSQPRGYVTNGFGADLGDVVPLLPGEEYVVTATFPLARGTYHAKAAVKVGDAKAESREIDIYVR